MIDHAITDARIALGSVAPIPLRLTEVEQLLNGKSIGPALIQSAKKAVAAAIQPIDDIRSTAKYRSAVAGNLVAEFLEKLAATKSAPQDRKSGVLASWNLLPNTEAADEILPCCGSRSLGAHRMAAKRPLPDEAMLLAASDEIWRSLSESDWLEAFRSHPRIGQSSRPKAASPQFAAWSSQEQRNVANADESVGTMLAQANRSYERKFNRIFIVCASGKSPEEILRNLCRRLESDEQTA